MHEIPECRADLYLCQPYLVQDEIYDEFAAKLTRQAKAFVLGDGSDEQVTMGPLIHQGAAAKVADLVSDAVAQGARLQHGCGSSELGSGFVEPGVLIDATPQMRIAQEEISDCSAVVAFQFEVEAIDLANATQAGLAAYFYTTDATRMVRVAEALEYGIVGINEGVVSNEMAPFGELKSR